MRIALALATVSSLACGSPPHTTERARAHADNAGATLHVVEAADLRDRAAFDALVLDLPSGDSWFIASSALDFLDHALVVCPDGNTRRLDAWAFAESARSGLSLDGGFLVTTDPDGPQPLEACDTTCVECPDGALLCTSTCDEPVARNPIAPATSGDDEATTGGTAGGGSGGEDDGSTNGGTSSGGSSSGSSSGSSGSTGAAGSTNHGGVGGGGSGPHGNW